MTSAETATGGEDAAQAIAPIVKPRPRDAATLILLDRSEGCPRVLLGKRSSRHVFMPDTYVFPGGRRDRQDHALPFSSDLHPVVLAKLSAERRTDRSARALALAAVRELQEETGLPLGETIGGRLHARLDSLRYIARAITPTGYPRRFDTRFFTTFADEAGISPDQVCDTAELHDVRWHALDALGDLDMPWITRAILGELDLLMQTDAALPFGSPVPFYRHRGRQYLHTPL